MLYKCNPYLFLLFFFVLLLMSCKDEKVSPILEGSRNRPWFEPLPHNMAFIKQGSFRMGVSDEQITGESSGVKTISVSSFWMDETEITNHQYQQFVKWAADSVLATLAAKNGITDYQKKSKNGEPIEPARIDWSKIDGIWSDENEQMESVRDSFYFQGKDRLSNRNEIDYHLIHYRYYFIDYKQAAKRSSEFNYETQRYEGDYIDPVTGEKKPIQNRNSFFHVKNIPVYPDTLCWIRDFTYSYNEPWTMKYFRHPAFYEYPVVGVSWEQANAFCHWRTDRKAEFLSLDLVGIDPVQPYRLPTEAEWEFAARGGLDNNLYPWGSFYATTEKGCYMANFKPKRGNYINDSNNSARTTKVANYSPNGYGLFDMAGNVAEWTSTAYVQSAYSVMNDFNPEISYEALPSDPAALKRKVIRGGSWKDVAYFLQVSTRSYEYQDTATSYVGFRCVMSSIANSPR